MPRLPLPHHVTVPVCYSPLLPAHTTATCRSRLMSLHTPAIVPTLHHLVDLRLPRSRYATPHTRTSTHTVAIHDAVATPLLLLGTFTAYDLICYCLFVLR